jgi:tricorn protease
MPEVPTGSGGLLGADFAIEGGRYKITRIFENESWNPDCARRCTRREWT